MTANNVEETGRENRPARNGNGSRRGLLLGLVVFFGLCGAGWAGYWHFFLSGSESTDNAYVAGNLVRVTARVAGNVAVLEVDNHQRVAEGQVLLRLDDTDARIALAKARAALADAVRQTGSLMAEALRLDAALAVRETELRKAEGDLRRRRAQRTSMAISEEDLRHAEDDHAAALMRLREAKEAREVTRVLLLDTPLEEQPQVVLAADAVREAWLALERCAVKSPVAGIVARRSVQVGMRVSPETPLMAVVPLDQIWVDANFKEVQLGRMRIGQKAAVRADMYGASVSFTGTVTGFSAGTGSSFSLLPPENATGNWIKVVQRVPVKIALDPKEIADRPLLVGLSCLVTVDTAGTVDTGKDGDAGRNSGLLPVAGPVAGPATGPAYATDVLAHDMTAVNAAIAAIIRDNKTITGPDAGPDAAPMGR